MIKMILNSITHVATTDYNEAKRQIISIHGMPFYKSSGLNSTFEGTWFPFFGIQEVDSGFYSKGHFLKPFLPIFDMALLELLVKYFPNNPYDDAMLHQRFGSHAGILLSSWLGGGLWDTENGKLLKQALENKYPDFYAHWPKPELTESEQEFTEDKDVNEWLRDKGDGTQLLQIKPFKLNELIDLYKPKPEQPQEEPQEQLPSIAAYQKEPQHLSFLYQLNKDKLGSVMNSNGHRRSARFMRKP